MKLEGCVRFRKRVPEPAKRVSGPGDDRLVSGQRLLYAGLHNRSINRVAIRAATFPISIPICFISVAPVASIAA